MRKQANKLIINCIIDATNEMIKKCDKINHESILEFVMNDFVFEEDDYFLFAREPANLYAINFMQHFIYVEHDIFMELPFEFNDIMRFLFEMCIIDVMNKVDNILDFRFEMELLRDNEEYLSNLIYEELKKAYDEKHKEENIA